MLDSIINKVVTTYFKLEEVPQKLLKYLSISLLAFFGWQSFLLLTLEPITVSNVQKATHWFLEFSFFMSIGTVSFFIKRWWSDKQQIDKFMEDDPFTKIEEMANMLEERDQALKDSEARLRAIFNTAPVGIGVVDSERNFQEVNKQFCKLLGYDNKDEILGKSVLEVYPSEDEYKRVGKIKYGQIEKSGVGSVETIFRRKDGSLMEALLTSTFLGKYRSEGTVFSILDLSDLTKAVREYELDEERLQALFDLVKTKFDNEESLISYTLEECVRITNSKIGYFHFTYDNKDQVKLGLFMWSKDTLKNCHAETMRHYPLEKAGIWADCVRFKRPVIHNDYENYPAKKGLPEGHFPLERHMSVPVFDGEGKLVAVVGVGNKDTDYGDTDARQLSLFVGSVWNIIDKMRTGFMFQELFENTDNGIAIYDTPNDGETFIFKDINPAGARIGQLPIDQHIGRKVEDVYPGLVDIGLYDCFKRVYKTGESERLPVSEYRDVNKILYVENYIFKLPSGEIAAVYNDITERVLAENVLAENEERFRKAIEYNTDAVVLVNKEGIIQYANTAMEELTGVVTSNLIGKQFGFPLATGEITNIDIVGTDGKTRCAEMRVSKIKSRGEELFIVSLRDFTDNSDICVEDTLCPIKDYRDEDTSS